MFSTLFRLEPLASIPYLIRIITRVQQGRIFGKISAEIKKKKTPHPETISGRVNRIIAPQGYSNDFFFSLFLGGLTGT